MNKYHVIEWSGAFADLVSSRRIPLFGAALGGGIPLLMTAWSYWADGWGTPSVLFLIGAGVGVVVGYRSAWRAVASTSPVKTSFGTAFLAAFVGTVVVITVDAFEALPSGEGAYWMPYVIVIGIPIGLIIGMMMSSPVALISVYLVRRMARRLGTGPRQTHMDRARR